MFIWMGLHFRNNGWVYTSEAKLHSLLPPIPPQPSPIPCISLLCKSCRQFRVIKDSIRLVIWWMLITWWTTATTTKNNSNVYFYVEVGWLRCLRIVQESIWKTSSSTVVSFRWATVDWFRLKVDTVCASSLHLKKKKAGNDSSNLFQTSSHARKKATPLPLLYVGFQLHYNHT